MIPEADYELIKAQVPILCVDVVLRRNQQYLLVQRAEEPLKGEWWVVGGRVERGECILAAAQRKVYEEVGLTEVDNYRVIGMHENAFEDRHTVSIVVRANIFGGKTWRWDINMDSTVSDWKLADDLPSAFTVEGFK